MFNYSVFNVRTREAYTPSVHGQGVVVAPEDIVIGDTTYIHCKFVKASGAVGKGQGCIIGGKTEKNLRYYQVLLPCDTELKGCCFEGAT